MAIDKDTRQDVTFSITLHSDEAVDPKLVADTIRDADTLLSDLERSIRGTADATVEWAWADDRPIELTAHVNGVSRDDLTRIVHEAERGFAALTASGASIQWPETFTRRAKNSAKRIVKRLETLDSITVQAEDDKPLTIEATNLPPQLGSHQISVRPKFRSSVEGVVDVVSVRGRLKASITEHNTRQIVKCSLSDDMFEAVKSVLKKRVVVEGMVTYREGGTPISISDVTLIRERKHGRNLDEFIGAAPNLTGGLDTEEFLEKLRGDNG